MKKKLLFLVALLFFEAHYSQEKNVSIGKIGSEPSAILEIASSHYNKTGSGAVATVTVDSNGSITAVNLESGGSGYVAPVEINIYGTGDSFPLAQGARATPTIENGVITAITVTEGGSGYISGKTIVSINPANKAMVMPRVDLVDVYNASNPVNAPDDGLQVYSNPTSIDSGIYFWDSSLPKWERGIPFIETPKGGLINFSGTDQLILDNGIGGNYVILTNGSEGNIYKYNMMSRMMGFKSIKLGADSYYSVNIEPGKYKLEITLYLTAPAPDLPSRATAINGTSGFYFMGYLLDLYVYQYDPVTMTRVVPSPSLPAPFTPLSTRLRKEYGVVSKIDQTHKMTQIYDVNIPFTMGKKYAFRLHLGRMTGSGFLDQFSFSREDSYIKINRY